ncbi:MAG: HlyD family secretion protein [Planctomycetota bacterium]
MAGRSAGLVVVVVAVGVGLAVTGLVVGSEPRGPTRVSGVIEADEVRVGSRVGGRVRAVEVQEGAAVVQSQVLVALEPFDVDDRIAEAAAGLEAARARLSRLEGGYRAQEVAQARARRDEVKAALAELEAGARVQEVRAGEEALKLSQAEEELAKLERDRAKELRQSGATTQEQVDIALTKWLVAAARTRTRREELALLREGARPERLAQARAQLAQAAAGLALAEAGFPAEEVAQARWEVRAAEARLAAARQARAELEVRAPAAGSVEALGLEPGDLVPANAPVITLRDPRQLWVRAYVPSPFLPRAGLGAELEVRVDGVAQPLRGVVRFVSATAEFTPSNVQTPEDRQQQVFRVKIALPPDAGLRPGMTADVILGDAPR